MSNYDLKPFDSDSSLAKRAALDFVGRVQAAGQKPFLVALSGGRITKSFFSFVVEEIKAGRIGIGHVHFFWADERCVPPDHADSNFILAKQHLLDPLQVSPANVHRLKGELTQAQAVADANADLIRIGGVNARMDLVLLGMGEDGHIASLFPNATPEVINCETAFQSINNSPKPPPDRLSLSYSALKNANDVWVLASGAGKEAALKQSLAPGNPQTPLGRLIQKRHLTTVYTDIVK